MKPRIRSRHGALPTFPKQNPHCYTPSMNHQQWPPVTGRKSTGPKRIMFRRQILLVCCSCACNTFFRLPGTIAAFTLLHSRPSLYPSSSSSYARRSPPSSSSSSSSSSSLLKPRVLSPTTTASTATALFGVRGFRAWFEEQFPDAVQTVDVSKVQESFDHVLIDMNQILHMVLRKSLSEEHGLKLLMMELDNVLRYAKPTKSLVLAIDGAPGAAKLATQRKRRYSILKNAQFKLDHFHKLMRQNSTAALALLGSSEGKRAKRLRSYRSDLQSLQLTPGTEKMQTFESAILYWAWHRLHAASFDRSKKKSSSSSSSSSLSSLLAPTVRIYFSSSQVTGEGEIKLLEWINNFQGMLERQKSPSIAFIGGDADMVLEAMVIQPTLTHNIFVLRKSENAPEKWSPYSFESSQGKFKPKKRNTKASLECTSLWEMTRTLDVYCRKNLPTEMYHPNLLLQIRTDLVLLTILNGNDYLPRMAASDFGRNFQIYMTLMKRWMKKAVDDRKSKNRSDDKGETPTLLDVGLIDPNTLNFRLKFAAAFFRALGVGSSSPQEQLRTVQGTNVKKTYQGILNDIASIGFVPTPVQFRVVDDITTDFVSASGHLKGNAPDDDSDEDEEGNDEEDDDFDEECFDDEDNEITNDNDVLELGDLPAAGLLEGGVLQLSLGKPGTASFRVYQQRLQDDSRESYASAKSELAERALEDAQVLQYFHPGGDLANLTYAWEIDRPAAPNIERYLAGLVWTLYSYQDGACPNYSYNYGKRLAPLGESIARYFDKARRNNQSVGAKDLIDSTSIGATFSGRAVSTGASSLAALPISMKSLVPEPYSLIDDDRTEEMYAMCVDPNDNLFDLQRFQELVETEILSMDSSKKKKCSLEENPQEASREGRSILLGDHYWSVLSLTKSVAHPFRPPPPPLDGFCYHRRNNRIKASRVICIDAPRRRTGLDNEVDSVMSNKHHWKHISYTYNSEVDHTDMGPLLNGSKRSVLDIPYKVAFGKERIKQEPVLSPSMPKPENPRNFPRFSLPALHPEQLNGAILDKTANGSLRLNPDGQNAKSVLQILNDTGVITDFTFGDTALSSTFLPVYNMTLSVNLAERRLDHSVLCRRKKSGREFLASRTLDDLLSRKPSKGGKKWHEMQLEDLKGVLRTRKSNEDSVNASTANHNAVEHLFKLKDIGYIEDCVFSESPTPPSMKYALEEMTLVVTKGVIGNGFPVGGRQIIFSKCRAKVGESKKTTKQILASMALDRLSSGSDDERQLNHTTAVWDTLPFSVVKSLLH